MKKNSPNPRIKYVYKCHTQTRARAHASTHVLSAIKGGKFFCLPISFIPLYSLFSCLFSFQDEALFIVTGGEEQSVTFFVLVFSFFFFSNDFFVVVQYLSHGFNKERKSEHTLVLKVKYLKLFALSVTLS